jgi:hypothetical protein
MKILIPVRVSLPVPHVTLGMMYEVLLRQGLELICKEKKIRVLEKELIELLA